jgi:dTMP kinase
MGLFITFEGIDASGKTTQIEYLEKSLRKFRSGIDIVLTKEPGGTTLGSRLRQEILHGEDIAPETEILLYLADRAEHIVRVIRPALEKGSVVICDRFSDSTIAYQCGGRGLNEESVLTANNLATGGLEPDLTFLLDISAHDSHSRLVQSSEKMDRLENSKASFFERTREKYLELAGASSSDNQGNRRFVVLDGNLGKEELAEKIFEVTVEHLG